MRFDSLFLTEDKASQETYQKMCGLTMKAILSSLQDGKAYEGLSPKELKKVIAKEEILPAHGLGFEKVLEKVEREVLPNFVKPASTTYMAHLHSPALMESLASELIISTFNQSMDSWDQSPVATEIELEVIRQLCLLYGYGENSDGVFTSGGSQSNLCCLMLARDWYCNTHLNYDIKKYGLPSQWQKLRIYVSELSHFSMEKSAHLMGLGYQSIVKVPADDRCRMDVSALSEMLERDAKAGLLPMCVVATIGTTDYGSIDDVVSLKELCQKYGMWLHSDAAYGSAAILSEKYCTRIGDLSLGDSLTVDFHKMFLLPISCSAILVKQGKDMEPFMLHADYLNREEDEEDGYINLVGKSIQTTRRFDALKVWVSFQCRGKDGYGEIIDTCIENAAYVYQRLVADSAFSVVTAPSLSSVVFRLAASDEVNKKVRRALLLEGAVIGQTVYRGKTYLKFTLLNPLITHDSLDELLSRIQRLGSA
ncbi:MAG: aspartate aminotransferase family protein [Sphaerochaetaceae bacterium]